MPPLALPEVSTTGPGDSTRAESDVCKGSGMLALCTDSGAPHISHDKSEGWFEKVHRGHWTVPSGFFGPWAPFRGVDGASGRLFVSEDDVRTGRPWLDEGAGDGAWWALLLEMAAFKTCARVGLMPQARHGGRGVWAFADAGSKLDGTGLEKLHMVQTQVAEVAVGGSGRTLGELSGLGEEVEPFR